MSAGQKGAATFQCVEPSVLAELHASMAARAQDLEERTERVEPAPRSKPQPWRGGGIRTQKQVSAGDLVAERMEPFAEEERIRHAALAQVQIPAVATRAGIAATREQRDFEGAASIGRELQRNHARLSVAQSRLAVVQEGIPEEYMADSTAEDARREIHRKLQESRAPKARRGVSKSVERALRAYL